MNNSVEALAGMGTFDARRARRFMTKWLREPLLHFVVAGLALWAAGEMHRRHVDTYRIVMTPQREAHLATRYSLQFGAPPDSATLERLVQQDIEEEMLFGRGLELQLDRDDEIVRRRIVQKMQFLIQDISAPAEPDDAQLGAYYAAHAERYVSPMRVTFAHVYFSLDEGEAMARSRAQAALDLLADARRSANRSASDLGDPFPDLSYFSAYEPDQVYRLFGRSGFSEAAFTAPVDRWVGPYRSGYGWHLLRVEARQQARRQEFAAVRDNVRSDYLLDAQAHANAIAFSELASEFTVIREKP
jgi:peptidyl-prolyl cis-trans isomerase C